MLLRTERSDPALIVDVNAVGRFEDDAARSLRRMMTKIGAWPALMTVGVINVYPQRKMCEVTPL